MDSEVADPLAWDLGLEEVRALSMELPLGRPPATGRMADWWEIIRPFSLPASLVPVAVGAADAWWGHHTNLAALLLALLGVLLLQCGTNIINEVYDVASGVDTADTPRASRVIVQGRMDPQVAVRGGVALLLGGVLAGAALSWGLGLGPIPFLLGVFGAAVGYCYTAPPLQFKYRGLGLPTEAMVMGPLMVLGAQFSQTGRFTLNGLLASLPVGLMVATIILANDMRDRDSDRAAGARTFAVLAGPRVAASGYVLLTTAAYCAVVWEVAAGVLPATALICLVSLPLGVRMVSHALPAAGPEGLARLDQESAATHMVFGLLLALGLWWAALHV